MNNAFGFFATKNIRLCAVALTVAIAVSMTGCPNDTTSTGGGTFVPVTDITGVPTQATAGTPLTLTGTVVPSGATNRAIVWSVYDAGTTGATIDGNTLNTTATGTATVRATIVNGASATADFIRDFVVTVSPAGFTLVPGDNLADRLEWLRGNAQDGNSYLVEITDDEYVAPDQTALPTDRSGIVIVLRGRDETLTVSLSANGSLFTVGSGITLVLDDNVTLLGRDANNNSLVQVANGGTLIMEEGSTVTGNTNTANAVDVGGGGVRIDAGGRFYMKGGEITGNKGIGTGSAGGVRVGVGSATFIMKGGKIAHNEVFNSGHGVGGVMILGNGATFVMKDGEITDNTASGSWSTGGVHVLLGRFYMEGGKIARNEAGGSQQHGGGVRVQGTFTMRGGEIFYNRTSGGQLNGGGVIVVGEETTFIMQGGRIFGNEDTGHDRTGGVFVIDNGTFQISNGIIYGVDAEDGRGNIGRTLNSTWGGGTLEHGTFNDDDEFAYLGTLDTTNYTIHVVNGELQ